MQIMRNSQNKVQPQNKVKPLKGKTFWMRSKFVVKWKKTFETDRYNYGSILWNSVAMDKAQTVAYHG